MGKIYKKKSGEQTHSIVEYEHATLEEHLSRGDQLGGLPAGINPAALHESLVEQALEDARAEAEARLQQAYTEGFRRGEEAGRSAFEQTVAGAAQALSAAAEAIQQAHESFLGSLEPQTMALVRGVVEHVLARELRADPDLVLGTIQRALACLTDRAVLRVRVHPDDLEAMRQHSASLLESFTGIVKLVVEPDEKVGRGGCVVDSETSQVDARIDEILRRVFEALMD